MPIVFNSAFRHEFFQVFSQINSIPSGKAAVLSSHGLPLQSGRNSRQLYLNLEVGGYSRSLLWQFTCHCLLVSIQKLHSTSKRGHPAIESGSHNSWPIMPEAEHSLYSKEIILQPKLSWNSASAMWDCEGKETLVAFFSWS